MDVRGEGGHSWILSAIYSNPHFGLRSSLWDSLRSLTENMDKPWCLVGDFNVVAELSEREGSSSSSHPKDASNFASFIRDCNLIDLGFVGLWFTWRRGRLKERLDRGLRNLDWRLLFLHASITHLNPLKSNHSPLLVNLTGTSEPNRQRRPFRFLASLMSHPSYHELIRTSWQIYPSWMETINQLKESLLVWNKKVFGDIFKRKKRLLRRINGITKKLPLGPNSFLEHLQTDLWKEYETTNKQEELLWFQKFRSKCLTYGDRNTRFFHASTIIRRRKT
ncbi:PREDICTED: uncharacterized protein LOC109332454 [Lupinus angustifolius]|uniref:uncharacterized protein LOC109332454 n=1 Tax=Lupinus angustifolius TaxID=3871 RepID=UPI00092E6F01|nr:PREDICTED: uncharacterized protein LOC109332454 [Lupinus angustifolius]